MPEDTQLELNVATAVRDNKESFYKYINKKRRTKEILYPWMWGRGEHCNQGSGKG